MKCVNRNGIIVKQNKSQDKVLRFLYNSKIGRMILVQIVKPKFSIMMGKVLNHPVSKILIKPFIKKNKINMSDYEVEKYSSYNDFFIRKIKADIRKIDQEPEHFIAPCDGKLSVYSIDKNSCFVIKNTSYTIESLLRNKKLADRYEGGLLLLFRLTVDDYHRFCYIDDGIKSENHHIRGVFHTVNPIANEMFPIYKENTREFSILKSNNFGELLIMEVGALLVGKIVNYHEQSKVERGQEKGRFEFGGSTIVVCVEQGRVIIDEDILENSKNEIETVVKMGERIGKKA
ncbi:phosphatidylserine decarboxylase [Tissierella praeacuta]|uniref:phosphatidylserine decarboxylase n=1 Tax=Tissierella praeacuta TaxID=43131 RepID=UPI0028991229|nr:phosphatidylserine decarboxylase [Tissierella praeacuta]